MSAIDILIKVIEFLGAVLIFVASFISLKTLKRSQAADNNAKPEATKARSAIRYCILLIIFCLAMLTFHLTRADPISRIEVAYISFYVSAALFGFVALAYVRITSKQ